MHFKLRKAMFVLLLMLSAPPLFAQRLSWDPFLDTLQHRTFLFFWDCTDPNTGLTPDRYPTLTFSSTAAIGFALTSYGIGAERGYITRTQAGQRVLTTLKYLWKAPQGADRMGRGGYKGFFYHFLDFQNGSRFAKDVELSSIDTGLLMAGVLFCQSYFSKSNAIEKEIRQYADSLYRRVDWDWMRNNSGLLSMGWYPERGFIDSYWRGYDESMILCILALGSPTHAVSEEVWIGRTSSYVWARYYGKEFVSFGPLFGHQYSHCWIDFRGIHDTYMKSKGIDYFENSRRATYTHQAYGKENPNHWRGYSDSLWGWTACDGPGDAAVTVDGKQRYFQSYSARGVSVDWTNDDGTIAPAAAGGSVAFAPEISVPALKTMRNAYGDIIWRPYGFADAFNPTFVTSSTSAKGWAAADYLGIDQGPIVIMIENLRSELVWNVMKKNPYVLQGLRQAGFTGGWLDKKK